MTNAPAEGQAAAVVDSPNTMPETPDQEAKANPLMAPELALLRDIQIPLNPLSLPNVRLMGSNVVINITTPDSVNSTEYKSAIAHLQARGCTVKIDDETSINFTHIQIAAPASLFSREAIAALEANRQAEETRAAARAVPRIEYIGVGC